MSYALTSEPLPHRHTPLDYSKIKVGIKTLDDAVIKLSDSKKPSDQFNTKEYVINCIKQQDYQSLIEISKYWFNVSGIYSRLCRYLAFMYNYDWMVTPKVVSTAMSADKLTEQFYKVLDYIDNFGVKKTFGEIALDVIVEGCYYGYKIETTDTIAIQKLPSKYCRSRFSVKGRNAIEFHMKFFEDYYRDEEQRKKILALFPKDFQKGYKLYQQNKLPPAFTGDQSGWYLLDPAFAFKFNICNNDIPMLIAVIPALIDFDEAQGVAKKRALQQLLKIVIQKMPIDKNGDLIFDIEESAQIHNNAVRMLSKAIGTDVLTTFADVTVADMSDSDDANATTANVDSAKSIVYDQAGVSQLQFNSENSVALEKSILNDEATMYNLILQFELFLNDMLVKFNKKKSKVLYRLQILKTTIYNYKELAKMYKEQMQLGYSKMLAQIALGQSQSSILANAYFENDILDLANVFIPPMSSNVMNAESLAAMSDKNNQNDTQANNKSGGGGGRPTKEEQGEVASEKTVKNRESAQ